MARIRSIKPGFWTDESIVQVSIPARLLLIGLGNESDDTGSFPWKALTLKMRLFPVDSVDVEALLAELVGVDLVRQYEVSGSKYGVIRNFRKHQSPRRPTEEHPIPEELRQYAGLTDLSDDKDHTKGKAKTQKSDTEEVKGGQFPTMAGTDPVKDASRSPGEERRGEEGSKKKSFVGNQVSYPPDFEKFWLDWQGSPARWGTHSKKAALGQWQKLAPEDRERAVGATRAYQADCKKNDHDPKHAERYLRDRVFENYNVNTSSLTTFTAVKGTPEHDAWSVHKRNLGVTFIPPRMTVPSPFPPVDPAPTPEEITQ